MTPMERALKSIEMTFGPDRKIVQDKIYALTRCASMLESPRWADRAFEIVKQYNIENIYELAYQLNILLDQEQDLVNHEFIVGADTNVRSIKKSLDIVYVLVDTEAELV